MDLSTSRCPVPLEQQPLNEYQSLRASCFFRWATLDLKPYLIRMILLWSLGCLISAPVAAGSFELVEFPGEFLLSSIVGATSLLALMVLRLYLGWSYVCDRLLSEKIVYEETGWYDGQYWTKPAAELTQNRLVGTYQVQPILRRLRVSFAVLGTVLLSSCLFWGVLIRI